MSAPRDITLNAARGVAIVSVVLGTAVGVALATARNGVGQPDTGRGAADHAHAGQFIPAWFGEAGVVSMIVGLTTLAFTLGLTVARAVETRGQVHYTLISLLRYGWLFGVWTILVWIMLCGLSFLAGRRFVQPGTFTPSSTHLHPFTRGWHWAVDELLRPSTSLWLLPLVAALAVLSAALRVWDWPRMATMLFAMATLWHWAEPRGVIGETGGALSGFFVAGAALAQREFHHFTRHPSFWFTGFLGTDVLALIVWFTEPVAPVTDDSRGPLWGVLMGVAAGCAGVFMCSVTGRICAYLPGLRWVLVTLGQRALDVFVAHIVLVPLSHLILLRLDVRNVWILLTIDLTAGIIGSLCLVTLAQKVHASWLFEMPRVLQRAVFFIAPPHRMRPGKHHRLP